MFLNDIQVRRFFFDFYIHVLLKNEKETLASSH